MDHGKESIADFIKANFPHIEMMEEYVTQNTEILFHCCKCDREWKEAPVNLANRKFACVCEREQAKTDNIRRLVSGKHPDVKLIESCTGINDLALFEHSCGHVFSDTPRNVIKRNSPCPKCSERKMPEHSSTFWDFEHYSDVSSIPKNFTKRKSNDAFEHQDRFIQFMEETYPDLILLSEYETSNYPVLIECSKCGKRWWETPSTLHNKRKHQCRFCSRNAPSDTWEKLEQKIRTEHPSLTIVAPDSPVNKNRKIVFKCSECKEQFTSTVNRVLSVNEPCPHCKGQHKTERFIQELAEKQPSLILISPYKSAQTPVKCRCKECGHEWTATPASLLSVQATNICPNCTKEQKQKKSSSGLKRNIPN